MAYFPGTQSFRQAYPLNRTRQGGSNRRATNAYGLPNLMARGMPVPGRAAGNRVPVGGSTSTTPGQQLQAATQKNTGTSVSPASGATVNNPYGYDRSNRLSIAQNRGRLEEQAVLRGEQWTPPWAAGRVGFGAAAASTATPAPGQGVANFGALATPQGLGQGQGGGQGQGQGNGQGQDYGQGMADEYQQALARMGLPLDPIYEMLSNKARSARDVGLMNVNTAYDVSKAQADLQNVLAHRSIDENAAARGLFDSGIERRNERLQNTDYTQGLLGLLQQKQLGTQSAYTGYADAMQQAILDLASRQMKDPYSAVPNYYDWQTGQSTIANNNGQNTQTGTGQTGAGGADRLARLRQLLQGGDLNQNQRQRVRGRIQGLR